ncbi:excinuclease ABC subunit UvrA, partial [Enterococcus faecium]
ALSVQNNGTNIGQTNELTIQKAVDFFTNLTLSEQEKVIAKPILKEVNDRLSFLENVGLDYLTLSRASGTLSGGEAQRIRLATQIGSNLSGVLYILDEPSIGLHQ